MRQAVLTVFAALIVMVGFLSGSSTAQQPPQTGLRFEVAVIRPGNPQAVGYGTNFRGGRFWMENAPLKQWVKMGLSVEEFALKAPSWLDSSSFDLNAKLPAGKPTDKQAVAEMIKALLIERFGLKWHEEIRTVPGYELVPDKKVLAKPLGLMERMLHPYPSSSYGPTGVSGTNISMSELAELLGKALGKPVVDATHLSGGFTVKLMWRPLDDTELAMQKRYGPQHGIDVDNLPSSVFAALREKLGLRLQSAKVQSKVIVVDQINRQPTEN